MPTALNLSNDYSYGFDLKSPFSIYGFGNAGRSLARTLIEKGFKIAFFIDQRAEKDQRIDGLNCITPKEIKKHGVTQVVLGVFNREASPKKIADALRAQGAISILGYHEAGYLIPGSIKGSFWFDPEFSYSAMAEQTATLRQQLSDQESKETLDQLLRFRQTGKITDHPEGTGIERQYFDVNIPDWLTSPNLTMLDCGAFDGDSIRAAIEYKANISKAICFEPDPENFQKLVKTCNGQSAINCITIPCATWSTTSKLNFSESQGESSRVTSSEGLTVQAVAIDDFVANSKFEFLKIDVEGADLDTLKGAIGSIKAMRPYIAVGIYHRPKDLWEIPAFLQSELNAYSYYLRQHGENGIDSVLYCIPKFQL